MSDDLVLYNVILNNKATGRPALNGVSREETIEKCAQHLSQFIPEFRDWILRYNMVIAHQCPIPHKVKFPIEDVIKIKQEILDAVVLLEM